MASDDTVRDDEARLVELEFKAAELEELIKKLKRERAHAQSSEDEKDFSRKIYEEEMKLMTTRENIQTLRDEEEEIEDEEAETVKEQNKLATVAGAVGAAGSAAGMVAGAAAGAAANAYAKRRAKRHHSRSSGGLWHKTKSGYQSLNQSFMDAQDNLGEKFQHHHPWIVALFALALHAWDAFNSFAVSAGHRTTMFIAYAVFTLWMIFAFYKTGFGEGSGQYIGLSLFAWALPYLRLIPLLGTNDYFIFMLTLLPVWFLYITLHEQDSKVLNFIGKSLLFIYAILLLLLIIFFVAGKNLLPDVSTPAATVGASLHRVWNDIKDVTAIMWTRTAPMFNPTAWKQKINATFNPRVTLYAGQVENNRHEPHGVYITKLESLYPKTYVGTAPLILGRIEAKTFIEGGLQLSPSCSLVRPGRGGWMGTPDVDPPITVNYQLIRDVMCTFPVVENMTPGTYNAYMSVSFDFETWAYITNTFVSHEVLAQYLQQGKDINRELDIDRNVEAVYTNGPVMIGMHNTVQPIDINPDAHTPVQQRFGFTIDDRWEQGTFKEFYSADVLIPEPFELEKCAPVTPSVVSQEDGVRTYRFVKSEGFDPRLELRTVTCQLVLPNKEAALEVIGFGEKTPVTFVVIARYNYAVEKKTMVRIEE